jgi:hypothetical protein
VCKIPGEKPQGIPKKNPVLQRNYCNSEEVTVLYLQWTMTWKHGRGNGNIATWKHRDMETWRHGT